MLLTKKLDHDRDRCQNAIRAIRLGCSERVTMSIDQSRRAFLSGAAGSALLPRTARSYTRIVGANDRIQIGQIGCGHRAVGHRRMLKLSSETDPKFDFRSVCDLWTVNR